MKKNIIKDLQNGNYYNSLKNFLVSIYQTCKSNPFSNPYSPYTTISNYTSYYSRSRSSDTNYLDIVLTIVLSVGFIVSVILCCRCCKNKKGKCCNCPSGGQSNPKNTNLSFNSYGGGAASIWRL